MRISWFLDGVCGLCAAAMAESPSLPFQVIVNSEQSYNALPNGFGGAQMVVGEGGKVAMNAVDPSGINPIIVYYSAGKLSTVADGTIMGQSGFESLSLSGNSSGGTRLTFAGINSAQTGVGVFQYDVDSSSMNQLADDGLGGLSMPSSINGQNLRVNAAGQVIFSAVGNDGSGSILVGDSSAATGHQLTTLFTSDTWTTSTPGSYNFALSQLAISASGTTGLATLATPANTDNAAIYTMSGGTPAYLCGTSQGFDVPGLLAAQQTGAVNAVLFLGPDTNVAHQEDYVLHDSSGNHLLGSYDNTVPQHGGVGAEMTTTGKLAFFLANPNGDTLQYYDVTTHSQTQIASTLTGDNAVVDPASPSAHYVISSFETHAPMINNNGIVIFDAEITGSTGTNQALLEWQPGGGAPIILLQAGDVIPALVTEPGTGVIDDDGMFIMTGDIFADSLSDDNYLGVDVSYDGGNQAALLVQLPEPTTLALLPVASLALLRRRQRTAG